MRLVRRDSIREEMELARDIPSAVLGALPRLRRGVRLSPALAGRLAGRRVRAVWIEDAAAGIRSALDNCPEAGRIREAVMQVAGRRGSPRAAQRRLVARARRNRNTMIAASVQAGAPILGQRAKAGLCDDRHHGRRRRFLGSPS